MTAIEDLLDGAACVASVYLRSPSAHADADHRYETRWKNARRSLADAGAPAELLAALDGDLAETGHGDATSFAIFRGASGCFRERIAEDVANSESYDTLPRLIGVLGARQRTVPHLSVVTDRIGADIIAVSAGHVTVQREVDGETEHVHRGRFGGWSHRRYQQRAENTWESNAKLVAEEVGAMAAKVGARIVTIAGDERASHLLLDRLGSSTRAISTLLDEGGDTEVAAATDRAVADLVAGDTAGVLRKLADRTGNAGAVHGVAGVMNALSVGRASTLLVHSDHTDDRRGYFGPGRATVCAPRRSDETPIEGRLVDVAVRSALLTHADVRVVPATEVEDGMAAILRW